MTLARVQSLAYMIMFWQAPRLWCRKECRCQSAALVNMGVEQGPRAPSCAKHVHPWHMAMNLPCFVGPEARIHVVACSATRQPQAQIHPEACRALFKFFGTSPSVRLRESSNLLTSAWSGPATTCSYNTCRAGRLFSGSSGRPLRL